MPASHRLPPTVALADRSELTTALERFGLRPPRPVLVVVGGAKALDPTIYATLLPILTHRLAPVLDRLQAVLIDGGTAMGVMALMGQMRIQARAHFPLIGVAVSDKVQTPRAPASARTALDQARSGILLVPGQVWGDEVPWIDAAARVLATGARAATLVIGGGAVTRRDVAASMNSHRPTLLIAGSGGTADQLIAENPNPPFETLALADLERELAPWLERVLGSV